MTTTIRLIWIRQIDREEKTNSIKSHTHTQTFLVLLCHFDKANRYWIVRSVYISRGKHEPKNTEQPATVIQNKIPHVVNVKEHGGFSVHSDFLRYFSVFSWSFGSYSPLGTFACCWKACCVMITVWRLMIHLIRTKLCLCLTRCIFFLHGVSVWLHS